MSKRNYREEAGHSRYTLQYNKSVVPRYGSYATYRTWEGAIEGAVGWLTKHPGRPGDRPRFQIGKVGNDWLLWRVR